VIARRRERRIPEHLGVVVGMDVDETRCHHATGGVDHFVAAQIRTDGGDTPVLEAHVGDETRRTGAVDDEAVLDDR
jgi:hypothetical protein